MWQMACCLLMSISMASGFALLFVMSTRIVPSAKRKHIAIRISHLMILFNRMTIWMLLLVIPAASAVFCLPPLSNLIAAIPLCSLLGPLLVTHLSRFALLRVRHSISNAMMAFTFGSLTWHQYLGKFEIVLQEQYHILRPGALTKASWSVCIAMAILSAVVLVLTDAVRCFWVNSAWLTIAALSSAVIVWSKTDIFDANARPDCYGTLREMHSVSVVLCALSVMYTAATATAPLYAVAAPECGTAVITQTVLFLGLSGIWILQIRYALRAEVSLRSAVPLQQILSSLCGYKAFLRFLVSELSIENLEFFQLSMRWRYRIACWKHGPSNGMRPPSDSVRQRLPFPLFSFQYVDRVLPAMDGGGFVPNDQEQVEMERKIKRDSHEYFSRLPVSRQGSVRSKRAGLTAHIPINSGSDHRRCSCSMNCTAASSLGMPPTIDEANEAEDDAADAEHSQNTNTRTSRNTYVLPMQQSLESMGMDYSRSSLTVQRSSHQSESTIATIFPQHCPQSETPSHLMRSWRRCSQRASSIEYLDCSRSPNRRGSQFMVTPLASDTDTAAPVIIGTVLEERSEAADGDGDGNGTVPLTPTQQSQSAQHFPAENNHSADTASSLCPMSPDVAKLGVAEISELRRECPPESDQRRAADQAVANRVDRVLSAAGSDTTATPQPTSLSPRMPLSPQSPRHFVSERAPSTKFETEPAAKEEADGADEETTDDRGGDQHEASMDSPSRWHQKHRVRFSDKIKRKTESPSRRHPSSASAKTEKLALALSDLLGVLPRRTDSEGDTDPPPVMGRRASASVLSGPRESSWLATWLSTKGPMGGQKERAETLLHFSDLSWRRMKVVMTEINVSADAKARMERLFRKYPRGSYLEGRGITLEEYDDAMHSAWISCWQNMNDSLRRFAKSPHYADYLTNLGLLDVQCQDSRHREPLTPECCF